MKKMLEFCNNFKNVPAYDNYITATTSFYKLLRIGESRRTSR